MIITHVFADPHRSLLLVHIKVALTKTQKWPHIGDLSPLAKAGVPILHVCGSLDPWLDRETRVAEKKYKELGGNFTVIIRQGEGHFAAGPQDPKPMVDFIVAKTN